MIRRSKRWHLISAALLGITGALLYALYERGIIGSHSLGNPFTVLQSNPYDGSWHYDIERIESETIRTSVLVARQNNYSPLVLNIDGPAASLLGYQLNSPIKSRFFAVCLKQDRLLLNSGGIGSDYCEIPRKGGYALTLRPLPTGALYCDNCRDYDFPSYWIKSSTDIDRQ